MDKEIINLVLSVFSNNLKSLIWIYNDSETIRHKKALKLEEKLQIDSWNTNEFMEYNHYTNHFDWILIQALFISGFSYFENFMRSIAKYVEKEKSHKIKIKDIRGEGNLDTYRKYLYLIGEISVAHNSTKEWQLIEEFRKIRNSIIHEYGEMSNELSIIKKYDIFFGPGKNMIRIKNIKFLEDFIETSINYMSSIIQEIENKNNGS